MMRINSFTWFSGAAILLLGCQTQVIGGSSGNGGNGGADTTLSTGTLLPPEETTSASTGAQPAPEDGPAIAMLRSQLPPPSVGDGSSGVTSTGGGPEEDPNTLFVFISNSSAQYCADPLSTTSNGCSAPVFQVSIALPVALQAVGTYSLDQLGFASFSAPEGGNICSGGGGSYWDGTIEITAIDATHVTFTLAGTGPLLLDNDNANGTYTAKRCF
jgi:hypothetical protein